MLFTDSHTEGEPTRVLLSDAYRLRPLQELLREWSDANGACVTPTALRALVANPRAPDACVGALLCRPSSPDADFGVFFFNAQAALGMCGHGAIGVGKTIDRFGGMLDGAVRIETRAGIVEVRRETNGAYSFENVPAFVVASRVKIALDQTIVTGTVAYGGNEFFLVEESRPLRSIEAELAYTRSIRDALVQQAVRGHTGLIDHVALFVQPAREDAQERSFVLCPNDTYDRSPCGTGSSARLAMLASEGRLREGAQHAIESAIGSRFIASFRGAAKGSIIARISGRAWITADGAMEEQRDPAQATGWSEST